MNPRILVPIALALAMLPAFHPWPVTAARVSATSQSSSATITGTWQLNVSHGHAIPFGLELKQDGSAVIGTLIIPAPHGGPRVSVPLAGTLSDGALALDATSDAPVDRAGMRIGARLKDDGTMEGQLSGGKTGVCEFTGERLGRR